MMCIALGRESIENQNRLADADCFSQLVRLLRRHKSSQKVMLMVIKVLGTLCVGKSPLQEIIRVIEMLSVQVYPFQFFVCFFFFPLKKCPSMDTKY